MTEQTASTFLITCGGGDWRVGLIWHPRLKCFLPASGPVGAAETSESAALREVREETGIPLRRFIPGPALPLPAGFPHAAAHPPWWTVVMTAAPDSHTPVLHVHVDAVYVAVADSQQPEDDAECVVRWFTADDLRAAASDINEDARLQAQMILATVDGRDQLIPWPGPVFG